MNSDVGHLRLNEESYKSEFTNVWKLFKLYKEGFFTKKETNELYLCRSVYTEGVGTTTGSKDSSYGAGLDLGDTGSIEKYKIGTNKTFLQAKKDNYSRKINRVEIDIFGFSRGAATARHFANRVKSNGINSLKTYVELNSYFTFSEKTDIDRIDVKTTIIYIGIFDTIATHGIGRKSKDIPINTHLPKDIADEGVYQIVAKDEHRENFSLVSLRSTIPDGMLARPGIWEEGRKREDVVHGVHSNVGGGYPDGEAEYTVIASGSGRGGEAALQAAKARDTNPDSVKLKYLSVAAGGLQNWEVVSEREAVRGDLSNVYLKLMWDHAIKKGVPLNPISQKDQLSPDMTELYNSMKNQTTPSGAAAQAASDGSHHSANNAIGSIDAIGMGSDKNYKRTIHPN